MNDQPPDYAASGETEIRIALVTNVLSHYRVPCFEALAARPGIDLTVFLLSHGMEHRRYVESSTQTDLRIEKLPGVAHHKPPFDDRHVNNPWRIMRGGFDVVVLSGWAEPTYLLLWAWQVIRRKPCLLWIESTVIESPSTGLKGLFKRTLLRLSAGCLVPGRRAAALCRRLGVDDEKIFVAPNAADREFFAAKAGQLLPRRNSIRDELGLTKPAILFVGRLVEEIKNVDLLFQAHAELHRQGVQTSLIIAGDGPDRERYEQCAAASPDLDIRFLGTLDHDDLCPIYAAADVLVLPSRSETWGFVLNEGMAFGLPLVVSDAVGAGPDLVSEGENGYSFPVGDARALASALKRLLTDTQARERYGGRSVLRLEKFTPDAWADGAVTAIRSVR